MGIQLHPNKKRNLIRLLGTLLGTLTLAGCKLEPLKIDPCAVVSEFTSIVICHAIPLNQPGKTEYDREIEYGDICVTPEDYAKIQKSYREIMRLCGDRCK